jgi:hypothetical protein
MISMFLGPSGHRAQTYNGQNQEEHKRKRGNSVARLSARWAAAVGAGEARHCNEKRSLDPGFLNKRRRVQNGLYTFDIQMLYRRVQYVFFSRNDVTTTGSIVHSNAGVIAKIAALNDLANFGNT